MFSLACITTVIGLSFTSGFDARLVRAIVWGGVVATVFGFVDDVIHLGARNKLLVQIALAAWVLVCFDGRPLVDLPFMPRWLDQALSWLGLVWLMNLYNFMDGIDGMAASGAVIISGTSILVLLLGGGDGSLVPIFATIALCSAGFLVFNWPPASIFMGDAGSLFLGFCFGALMAGTISRGEIGLWSWLIIFGYFAGDTTTTALVRLFVTKKWYGAHRSHAYQNLARISGSHLKVVRGVSLYHLLWLLPLAIWSVFTPPAAPIGAVLALLPVVLWTLRHGPLLSSS